jgi:hypothetical protein
MPVVGILPLGVVDLGLAHACELNVVRAIPVGYQPRLAG